MDMVHMVDVVLVLDEFTQETMQSRGHGNHGNAL